jgi:hypothetical protein
MPPPSPSRVSYRTTPRRALLAGAGILLTAACGARTGLDTPDGGGVPPISLASDAAPPPPRDAGDPPPDVPPSTACCARDDENTQYPPSVNCTHGVDWLAWDHIASCTYELATIGYHTEGELAVLADDHGRPGAVRYRGRLIPDGDGWSTFTLSPPMHVTAGERIWLAEHASQCSIASDGRVQNEWASQSSSPSGPWDGPYAAHPYTARFIAACP